MSQTRPRLHGGPALRMAIAKLTGAVWRTAEQPEAEAVAELRAIAIETAGPDQAAQACADSADYFRRQVEDGSLQIKDPAPLMDRLDQLATELAGHPVKPAPRTPPISSAPSGGRY